MPVRSREEYLERERQYLAPYASKAGDSRGRAHAESEHPLRSPYERDRDRIIHSRAFRKLEYKTQVFVNHEGDYYRTRLTHTLEVAQIARSAARFLHANEDLVEAVALVHDVGHPPFGHAGEEALQACMAAHGGFEHNLHALRVMDELENHYPDFSGLNLTWEVREGIVKHSKVWKGLGTPGSAGGDARMAELEREFAGAPWPSLEAQLVDVCDEIAYNAHDVDDGLAAGMIDLKDLEGIELWRQILDSKHPLSRQHLRYQGIRALIDAQVQDLVETVIRRAGEWRLSSPDAVRAAPGPLADLSPEMTALNTDLRHFLFERVYRHFRVLRMGVKARRILGEMFRSLVEAPGQLPADCGLRIADSGLEAAPVRSPSTLPSARPSLRVGTRAIRNEVARVVCDYLAGLSDREALSEHARLFDPSVPS